MIEDINNEVLTNWGIKAKEVISKTSSIFEIDHQFILKRYNDIEKIKKNIKIIQTLISLGIPVPTVIHTKDKQFYFILDNYQYLLMKKLPGDRISEINDKNVGFLMGKVIGDLHLAFLKFENLMTFRENSLLSEIEGWVKNNFEQDEWKLVKESEYLNIVDQIRIVNNDLPRQLIHRDVHLGNFLFLNGQLSGYIDFDLSQKNIRIFDICYFLAGLLSDQNVNKITDEDWLLLVKETIKGYETRILLTDKEKFILPFVMEGIELLCISYFLGINNSNFAFQSLQTYNRIKKIEADILKVIKE